MVAACADFRGIVALDHALVEQLTRFLREREEALAGEIKQTLQPMYSPIEVKDSSLASLLATLGHAKHVSNTQIPIRRVQAELNGALWRFIEVLEGGVAELFEQLDQVELAHWTEELSSVVGSLTTLFRNHLGGISLALKKLEELLVVCRDYAEVGKERVRWLQRLLHLGGHLLDQQLSQNVEKTRSYLDGRFLNWKQRYETFIRYDGRAETASSQSLGSHATFLSLPASSQTLLLYLERMVKVWELDARATAVLLEDLMRAVRSSVRPEAAYEAFQAYFQVLKGKLFETSREIKTNKTLDLAASAVDLGGFRSEVIALKQSVARFREFLLRTDPNPYVRSRWGFPEWVVGPEPERCRQLLHLEYRIEALDRLYAALNQSLTSRAIEQDNDSTEVRMGEIQGILHSMSQPLLSRHAISVEVQKLLDKLNHFDELASTSPDAIDFVGVTLLRALRYDAKYTLLYDNTLFQKLYTTHHELVVPLLADSEHREQVAKMRYHVSRILRWVGKGHGEKHLGDINTLQKELNHYFAQLQNRLSNQLQTAQGQQDVRAMRQQVLEFRHLLGDFYHRLGHLGLQGRQVRGHFVAIDHQLDGIESHFSSL